MKKARFLVCTVMPLLTQCAYVEASGAESVAPRKLFFDAGGIFKNWSKSDFLEFTWQNGKQVDRLYLAKLRIKRSPDEITDLMLTIPGRVDGKEVGIRPEAFSEIKSDTLRLHLIFREVSGGKVRMPLSCGGMFRNSTAVYSIDFSGIDTSGVMSMKEMFLGCKNIQALDLRPFDMKGVGALGLNKMFLGCDALRWVNIYSIPENWGSRNELLYKMFSDEESVPSQGLRPSYATEVIVLQKRLHVATSRLEDMPAQYKGKSWANANTGKTTNRCVSNVERLAGSKRAGENNNTPQATKAYTTQTSIRAATSVNAPTLQDRDTIEKAVLNEIKRKKPWYSYVITVWEIGRAKVLSWFGK